MEDRRVGMEMKKPRIKSMKSDDFHDNETLAKIASEHRAGAANVAA